MFFLEMRRIFAVPREAVFRAWTEPDRLKKWWHVKKGWTTPIAEVDLRVGGRFRLGMQSPQGSPAITSGVYRVVEPPQKLSFTWCWEGKEQETLVTIEFLERGDKTELILKHENFPDEKLRDEHRLGWGGCLDHLGEFLAEISFGM